MMKEKIKEIWRNRNKIMQGIYNYFINFKERNEIKRMSLTRLNICRSNSCGYYDKLGESEKAFVKGKEACGVCGCNLKLLTSSQDSTCSLIDLGKIPLWKNTKL